MRLVYVANARIPTEKAHGLQIMKTCEALARAGVEVELIVPRRRNPIHEDPFSYYGIQKRFPVRKLFTLDLVRFGRIGFLIQEGTFSIAAALGIRSSRRVIYGRDEVVLFVLWLFGARTFVWESHTGAWNAAARVVAKHCSTLVVISNGLKIFYVQHGIPSEKIVVIPSSFEPEQFAHPESKDPSRARLQLGNKKIAMYIGRLDGWKGSATLLDASELLPDDVEVVVIGGEPAQTQMLEKRYPRVRFLGFRPYRELADNQAAADVLVVPNTGKDDISRNFTSPLKLLAHMASGRPVVASDLPSIREIAGNGEALLVPPDDPSALAAGIMQVLQHPADAEQLIEKARKRIPAYSWDARAKAIIAVLAQH